ncbi:Predicted GTPase [Mycoplasma suis KI3806]|uniref:Predicted GTPase n=1 Tax=Mycoplasma suis (strain KI_3806) TaxID=708248 RepID=F0V1J6_MYCS3|nr:GTPase [Mycoplasma suis]CBZ40527.1 Predicted GTPase [Mycoplasma suis KI3806]
MPYLSLIILLVDSRVLDLDRIYLSEIRKRWPKKNILPIYTKSDLSLGVKHKNSFNLLQPSSRRKLIKLIREEIEKSDLDDKEKTNSAIVMGGANSGKSSFINLLVGKKKAKKSPEPGTTRALSRHKIPSTNLIIYDSPGIFPPNLGRNSKTLFQLLNFLPSTPDSRENYSEWAFEYLKENYPEKIVLLSSSENQESLESYDSFIRELAQKYKLLEKKGELSLFRAEQKFVELIRKGAIGRITWKIYNS